ncbi:aryl-sulfate sulfotransferase [Thalassotalea sp. ND16A]|uniref:aryl-sulfate sulfotransferase n=1 Tax=Thalassotalea sp. ND16A TaxID=1535422 RepID=UPI00051A2156|nr:aryl-sulfate sulfotransferase [Thalassotalea sp. ND16A]KGJ94213.1 hypothetical protein ND16A_1419 [Thalassotalea sp. ND16A]
MKIRWIFPIVVAIFLTGCFDSDNGSNSADHLIADFSTLENNNIFVTHYTVEDNEYIFHFEDGRTFKFFVDDITSVTEDLTNNKLTIVVNADSSITVSYLKNYTLEIPDSAITLNPTGYCPLCASINIETQISGIIHFRIISKNNIADFEHQFSDVTANHQVPILGLYNNYPNEIEISFLNNHGNVRASKIVTIVTTDNEHNNASVSLVNYPDNIPRFFFLSTFQAFDQSGELRWIYTNPLAGRIYRQLDNDHLLIDGTRGYIYHRRELLEIDMLGNEIGRYTVPNQTHHDAIQLPNGNFLVASNSTDPVNGNDGLPEEDYIVEISKQTGLVISSWDLNNIVDPTRQMLQGISRNDDWAHLNSIEYDPSDDSIIVSLRNQSAVIKFDKTTSALKWIIGAHNFWVQPFTSSLLEPINFGANVADWNFGQHHATLLPNGNILMHDNGNYRSFSPDADLRTYTRAVEYKIDEENKTIEQVWEYDFNREIFAAGLGAASYEHSTGNRTISSADNNGFTRFVEVTGEINPSLIFEMNITDERIYRIQKHPLYR